MIDRKIEPKYSAIESIAIIEPKQYKLDNGIVLYALNAGTQDLVKIDFIFDAGEWTQKQRLIANTTTMMLSEGTQSYTSEQLAEHFDFHGTYLYYQTGKHSNTITVYTLNKYMEQSLRYVEEILKKPIFPEQQLNKYIKKKRQQYLIENEKVEVIAQKKFAKTIFGINHPYGNIASAHDFDNITNNQLVDYHAHNYTSQNCYIIISGKILDSHIKTINTVFGKNHWNGSDSIKSVSKFSIESSIEKKISIEKKDSVQSAIRLGSIMVNKLNPDFRKLQVLNTIFGGYFGSRLMSNIREDKGYTYGIGSGIVSQKEAGYFVVVSQVGKDVCNAAITEVFNEMKRLRTELIPADELQVVKNYMLGSMLRNFDGSFAQSDILKVINEYGINYEFYHQFINIIKEISSEELLFLAEKYFNEDSMYEIVVG